MKTINLKGIMRKTIAFFTLYLLAGSLFAQSPKYDARAEIKADIGLAGSNYLAYRDPTVALTPAPKGYEAFYLSHYGRHGSRWLCNDSQFAEPIALLERADAQGKLTDKGRDMLRRMKLFYTTAVRRAGELTWVGEAQHHRIGRRMAEHFPSIFKAQDCQINARSTVVIRCILSMEAECEELAAANPKSRIHNDVSESFQYYLNADWPQFVSDSVGENWKKLSFDQKKEYYHPDRFWSSIFTDPAYRDEKTGSRTHFMRQVLDFCNNMQSHYADTTNRCNLYGFFTEDEIYDNWRSRNLEWYLNYAYGKAPWSQSELLKNFLSTADTITQSRTYHGATLRFGHEVCVMPLACLLELGDCYPQISPVKWCDLGSYWTNYRIYPMGSNIQLIFYRSRKDASAPVLVKALLNEREVSLPIKTDLYPYYNWNELRRYYQNKLK